MWMFDHLLQQIEQKNQIGSAVTILSPAKTLKQGGKPWMSLEHMLTEIKYGTDSSKQVSYLAAEISAVIT